MRRRAMPRVIGAALFATLACAGSAKRETSALANAVDRYRRADNTAKVAQARLVAAVACTDANVCDAKRTCLAAIDPTAHALAIKDEVAHRLSDVEQKRVTLDSPEVQALPTKLDEAERLLNEGRARMLDCEKKLADLLFAYGS